MGAHNQYGLPARCERQKPFLVAQQNDPAFCCTLGDTLMGRIVDIPPGVRRIIDGPRCKQTA